MPVARSLWISLALSCAGTPPAPTPPTIRSGPAMFEIGIRFERAAHAVAAGRWELAIYDVDEIAEVFESELVGAKWMANASAAKLARKFSTESIPTMQKALRARDARGFGLVLGGVARACNECHRDVGKAFIEISETPGASVPVLR